MSGVGDRVAESSSEEGGAMLGLSVCLCMCVCSDVLLNPLVTLPRPAVLVGTRPGFEFSWQPG